jgi:hypothetical protein
LPDFWQERALVEAEERKMHEADKLDQPNVPVRTAAEPRPNAYVQEYMGVPKPYGGFAPFKPSELGTNMRHIRKPAQVEIEI